MSDRIVVEVEGFQGDYEWDDSPLTGREYHWIKRISGVRANEMREALQAGDYDLIVALAVIVMRRAGKFPAEQVLPVADKLLDAPSGAIRLIIGQVEQEDAEGPPPQAPKPELVVSDGDGASETSSGASSANGSGSLDEIPEPTGTPV